MSNIDDLALAALKADMLAKDAEDKAKEAKANLYEALEKAGALNPDTKALGHVRTKIQPNRYFAVDEALQSLPKKVQKEVMVSKPDPKLVQGHLTPIQRETFMKDHPQRFKLSLEVLKED